MTLTGLVMSLGQGKFIQCSSPKAPSQTGMYSTLLVDTRYIPFLLSVFLLVLQMCYMVFGMAKTQNIARIKALISEIDYGGWVIFGFMILRVLFSAILVALEAIVLCSGVNELLTPWGPIHYCMGDLMLGAAVSQNLLQFNPTLTCFLVFRIHSIHYCFWAAHMALFG